MKGKRFLRCDVSGCYRLGTTGLHDPRERGLLGSLSLFLTPQHQMAVVVKRVVVRCVTLLLTDEGMEE